MSANRTPNWGKLGLSLWHRLTKPAASVQSSDKAHTARLLSSLLLMTLLVIIIDVVYGACFSGFPPVVFAAGVVVAIAYTLSRTRYYTVAVWLSLLLLSIPSFASALGHADVSEMAVHAHLVWLMLPILLSGLLLSTWGVVAVAATISVSVLLLPVLVPALSFRYVVGALGIVFITSGLTAVSIHYHRQMERGRQARLRKSEEKHRSLAENALDFIMIVDRDGVISFINRVVPGYTIDETIGMSIYDCVSAEHHDRVKQCVEKVFETGESGTYEINGRGPHGITRWFSTLVWPVKHEDQVVNTVHISRDITKHKQEEETLRENEELLDSILTASAVGIAYAKDRNILWANDAMAKLFGFTEEGQYLGKATKMLYASEEEHSRVGKIAYEQQRAGRLVEFDAGFKRHDGSLFDGHVKINALDPLDPLKGVIVSIIDITERKRAEEALRKSERFLGNVFDAIQDGISILDRDLTILQTNRWMEEMYAAHVPLTGKKCYTAYQERSSPCPWCPSLPTLETGKQHTEIVPYPSTEEPTGWIELTAFPLKGDDGQITGIIEHFKDITQLRESEERYRTLFESAPDAIFLADPDTGKILDVNPAAARLLAKTRDGIVGMHQSQLHPPEMAEFTKKAFVEHAQQTQEEGKHPIEAVVLRADGSRVPVEILAKMVQLPGRQILQGVFRDVSERVWAAEEQERLTAQIRDEARRVQQIITTVPEGVLLLDTEGHILLANPVAEKDLAVLVSQDVITTHKPITYLGDRSLTKILTSPLAKGLRHEVKAGERIFEVIARPMENGNEAEDWVLVINDVTQEREAQKWVRQQERLAAVGQMAAGIAHDFNNILAVITLYSQMITRSKALSDHDRDRMAMVNQQAQRAAQLIQQILDFSRRAVLARQPLDLLSLLKEEIKLLKRTLPEHIEIDLAYEPNKYIIQADSTRIRQMVTNLALNAQDAMPQGGALHIKLERTKIECDEVPPLPEMAAGEWIQLTVSDTGTGIAPDVLPHIFEPFFTTKGPSIGTGLGLAQVHGIVGQHEGHIDVESHVGEGTTFTIYLPVLAVQLIEPSMPEPTMTPQGQGETVLVVEDEASLRKTLVETLEQLNYRVLEAANGRDGLEILDQHEVALVLSDVVMPEMGGIALFRTMKREGVAVPMVLLTGHPMEKELQDLQTEGLSAWLIKPSSLEQLAKVIAQILNEKLE
jgi:two-component system cell cycle sensor histidine kinase/response regulator CckA